MSFTRTSDTMMHVVARTQAIAHLHYLCQVIGNSSPLYLGVSLLCRAIIPIPNQLLSCACGLSAASLREQEEPSYQGGRVTGSHPCGATAKLEEDVERLEVGRRREMRTRLLPRNHGGARAAWLQVPFLLVVAAGLYWLGVARGSSLPSPGTLTKSLFLSFKPACGAPTAALDGKLLFLRRDRSTTTWGESAGLGMRRTFSPYGSTEKLLEGTETVARANSLSRLQGFSLLLNPDAATSEQQLEKMYANAARQFARLWAESGVQRELRQRSRYTRRVTRGEGGRREVLRRRLQGRMLLRQQKETGSNIQWHEPLQLNARQLELLIKAMKSNSQLEAAKTEQGKTNPQQDGEGVSR
ncbi:hypothetical protein Esti_001829 [Eimeria stiedai]